MRYRHLNSVIVRCVLSRGAPPRRPPGTLRRISQESRTKAEASPSGAKTSLTHLLHELRHQPRLSRISLPYPRSCGYHFCFFFFRVVRAISTARLNASPRLHLRPIDVVVFDGPHARPNLGVGFVLRCFQHLSCPDAATRLCRWRDNRCTGGLSSTVLSY